MLFSDIRDFSVHSETMKNAELFEWLQSYVSRMAKATVNQSGYIDQYIGDALFCVFPQPTNGLNAAIEMQEQVEELNVEHLGKDSKLVEIGVGLHYGVVIAGVFGDSSRLSCTTIASDVNLASRLEALTKSFGAKIIASEAVVSQIDKTRYLMRALGLVQVSGSSQAISIFDVFQTDSQDVKEHKQSTLEEFEAAIKLAETDLEQAGRAFAAIAQKARQTGLHDRAAEKRADAAYLSPNGSVLGFDKKGDLRNSSASVVGNGSFSRGASMGSLKTGLLSPQMPVRTPLSGSLGSPVKGGSTRF